MDLEDLYDHANEESDRFRRGLSEWKQKQLDIILGDTQDTLKLNAYLKRTGEMYINMKKYIEDNTSKPKIDKDLLQLLGDPQQLSSDTRVNILHTIFRDLIEFPFTYDTTLINSFQESNVQPKNIVGNE